MNKSVVALPAQTVIRIVSASSASVNVRRGVAYRVVADVDIWINSTNATATNADFYIPAKTVEILAFDHVSSSSEATQAITILGSGAGRCYLTPMIPAITAQ